jgi:anti-sigma factor RsiW
MSVCDPDNLTAFVDGTLDDAAARRMAEHLRECPRCAGIARDHRAVKAAVAGLAAGVVVPSGLARRVGGALDRLPPPRPPQGRGLGVPLSIAALVATTGLWFSRPLWQAPPVDVQALMWHHRDAIQPPPGQSLATTDSGAARQWLAARLEAGSRAPALRLPLRGVGVCRVADGPAAVWMYRAERPVSLIEMMDTERLPAWDAAPHPAAPGGLRIGSYGGYNAVIWQARGHTFALISDLSTDRLLNIVEQRP